MKEETKRFLCRNMYSRIEEDMGKKSCGRGWIYRNNVGTIYEMEDRFVATVQGTYLYITNLFCNEKKQLASVCTCPVGVNCKHGAALAFVVSEKLCCLNTFETNVPDEMCLDTKPVFKRTESEKKEGEPYTEEDLRIITKYKQDVSEARERLLKSCEQGDRKCITEAAIHLQLCIEDEAIYDYADAFDAEFASVNPTMQIAANALRKNGISEAELIVWACYLNRPCQSCLINDTLISLIESPQGAQGNPQVWKDAAVVLEKEMDDYYLDGEEDREFNPEYQLGMLRDLWRLAGDEARAIPIWLKYVDKVENYGMAANFLMSQAHYDGVIDVVRKGLNTFDYTYDELIPFLADAFTKKGDHIKAVAIRAEFFLFLQGYYACCRTIGMFNTLLSEADHIGVKEPLKRAIIYALETGHTPTPLIDWPAEPKELQNKLEENSRNIEEPPWPLPRANEAMKHSEFRGFRQQDLEFLLRLAIIERDKEAAANYFAELPEYPCLTMEVPEDVLDMLRDLITLVQDSRPDIVEIIHNSDLHWTSPRNKPKSLRENLKKGH